MRYFKNLSIFLVLIFASISNGQELNRQQKLQKIEELQLQIKKLANEYLLPDAKDIAEAKKEGIEVFRILPRGMLNGKVGIREGGAYYSFTTKSHDYDDTPQIGLEQNYLKVGFAGADYGFIADLGEMPLGSVTKETPEINFLVNYKPPINEPEVRVEQRKAWNYETNGLTYKSGLPAIVGHTYILRAISFGDADVLVAFKVHRKDSDGSLIIFWKNIKNFETPKLERNKANTDTSQNSDTKVETIDYETANAVQNALMQEGLFGVTVEATNKTITLRGTIPKGKMAYAVRVATETGRRPVKNELTEK